MCADPNHQPNQLRSIPIDRQDRDQLRQAAHEMNRLALVEQARAVGDHVEVGRLLDGIDPVEIMDLSAKLGALAACYEVGRPMDWPTNQGHSLRTPEHVKFRDRGRA